MFFANEPSQDAFDDDEDQAKASTKAATSTEAATEEKGKASSASDLKKGKYLDWCVRDAVHGKGGPAVEGKGTYKCQGNYDGKTTWGDCFPSCEDGLTCKGGDSKPGQDKGYTAGDCQPRKGSWCVRAEIHGKGGPADQDKKGTYNCQGDWYGKTKWGDCFPGCGRADLKCVGGSAKPGQEKGYNAGYCKEKDSKASTALDLKKGKYLDWCVRDAVHGKGGPTVEGKGTYKCEGNYDGKTTWGDCFPSCVDGLTCKGGDSKPGQDKGYTAGDCQPRKGSWCVRAEIHGKGGPADQDKKGTYNCQGDWYGKTKWGDCFPGCGRADLKCVGGSAKPGQEKGYNAGYCKEKDSFIEEQVGFPRIVRVKRFHDHRRRELRRDCEHRRMRGLLAKNHGLLAI